MDNPVSDQLNIVIPAYHWHSQNFLMALDGIAEEDALKRVDGRTNHIVWMAGNFVNARYWLGAALGLKEQDPNSDLFSEAKALNESFTYPSLKALKENFHTISPLVYKKLLEVRDEELAKLFPMGMNVSFSPETILNFIGMCTGREDYLCGQMGLMRRILNYPGIKYEVDEKMEY